MFVRSLLSLSLIFASLFLYSCKNTSNSLRSPEKRLQYTTQLASKNDFSSGRIRSGKFLIKYFYKKGPNPEETNIYIEGDGLAWERKNKLSDNPTPINPMGLRLAIKDPTKSNIIYIARPCQYVDDPNCKSKYWSGGRFSSEIINSIAGAIGYLTSKTPNTNINLIGYSGGGNIATIIAGKNKKVKTLRTIAGNLNHNLLNKHHNVTPLKNSLDAVDFANNVKNTPQIHFTSKNDTIVPPKVAYSFLQRLNKKNCTKIYEENSATHHKKWEELWPKLISTKPRCL